MSLKKQILVVEDNQINREMLRMILSGQYDVTAVSYTHLTLPTN